MWAFLLIHYYMKHVVLSLWLLVAAVVTMALACCSGSDRSVDAEAGRAQVEEVAQRAQECFHRNDFLQAANLHRHAISMSDSLGLPEAERIPFYNGLAQVYIRFADYGSALLYSDMALALVNDELDLALAFSTWNTRCNTFFYRHEYEKALSCTEQALRCASAFGNELSYHVALINRADILTRLNRFEGVTAMLDSCERVFVEHNFEGALHYTVSLRGLYALRCEHDFQKAERYLNQEPFMVHDQTMNYVRLENLRELYKTNGDLPSAYRLDEILLATKDSLLNRQSALRVANLELQYQDNIREMELKSSLRRERLYTVNVSAGLLILLLIIIIVAYHLRSVRRKRDLEVAHMQESLMAEKVRNLRARLSPHYLSNVLRQLGDDSTSGFNSERIQLLNKTLRSSLEMSDNAVICLKREVDFVQDYLQLRPQSPRFDVHWQIDGDLDLWQTMIPGMIIQLPVENALKYAYENGGSINICIERAERERTQGVRIVVEDFGRGLQKDAKASGIGLAILTRTISFINMYNANTPLDMLVTDKALRSQGQGVKVEFFIPKLWKSPFQS